MPYVLKAYGDSAAVKLRTLGAAAGVCTDSDSPREGADRFIEAVRQMNARLGIPDHIEGIRAEDIPQMAAYAEKEANPLYPVPALMTRRERAQFYYQIADWSR